MLDRVVVAILVEVDSVHDRDVSKLEERGTLGACHSLLPPSPSPPPAPRAMFPLSTLLGPPPPPRIPVACRISARALLLLTLLLSGLKSTTMTLPCEVGVDTGTTLGVAMVPRGNVEGFCSTFVPELPLRVFPMVILVGTSWKKKELD